MKKLLCKILGHSKLLNKITVRKCDNYNAAKNRKFYVENTTLCNKCFEVIKTNRTADMNTQSTVSYLLKNT